jgi:hypothetical protein
MSIVLIALLDDVASGGREQPFSDRRGLAPSLTKSSAAVIDPPA